MALDGFPRGLDEGPHGFLHDSIGVNAARGDHQHFFDEMRFGERGLHPLGVDVLAARQDDQILFAAGDVEVTRLIEIAKIARVQPADPVGVGADGGLGRGGVGEGSYVGEQACLASRFLPALLTRFRPQRETAKSHNMQRYAGRFWHRENSKALQSDHRSGLAPA